MIIQVCVGVCLFSLGGGGIRHKLEIVFCSLANVSCFAMFWGRERVQQDPTYMNSPRGLPVFVVAGQGLWVV
jgi:hypothetical protein